MLPDLLNTDKLRRARQKRGGWSLADLLSTDKLGCGKGDGVEVGFQDVEKVVMSL